MTYRNLSILVLLLTLLLPVSMKAQDVEIVEIAQLYNDAKYKEARAMGAELVKKYPSYDAAYYYMGLCDMFLNQYELAQDEFKTASKLSPDNYWYRDRLAISYSATGDDAMTIETYEKMLVDFPKQTDVYYSLVNLYLRHNNLDKALEVMEDIENVAGKSEQITLTRYEILLHQNKPDLAKKALEDFNKDYSSPQVTTALGDHLLAEYEDSTALACYQEALALDKGYAPALLGRSEVYRIRRDYTNYFSSMKEFVSSPDIPALDKSNYLSALLQRIDGRFVQNFKKDLDDLYSTCVSLHNTDSTMLQSAATYYYRTERIDAAIDMFERCAELYPKSISAVGTYVEILGIAEQWDRLIEACDKAIETFPEESAFYSYKSSAYYYKENYEGVLDVDRLIMTKFASDTSKTIPAMSSMGDMYHQLGKAKEAYKIYDKVLKLRPDYAPVLNNYAYYLSVENKKLSKAAAMSKICVEKEPDNATYLDTYAWILFLQGKASEAKPLFKHAMLYGGKDSAVILDHYAEVLYALGEYDLARVYWRQAKEKNTDGSVPDLDARIDKREAALKK